MPRGWANGGARLENKTVVVPGWLPRRGGLRAACKAGLVALSKTLTCERSRHAIALNVVCPGPGGARLFADCRQGAGNHEELLAEFGQSIPLGRIGRPDNLCDAILSGRSGPRVGSVDPRYGTAFPARVVGEKKARGIRCPFRRHSAAEALATGLVDTVVSHEQFDAEVSEWCGEIMDKRPTAIGIAKRSFNANTVHSPASPAWPCAL